MIYTRQDVAAGDIAPELSDSRDYGGTMTAFSLSGDSWSLISWRARGLGLAPQAGRGDSIYSSLRRPTLVGDNPRDGGRSGRCQS